MSKIPKKGNDLNPSKYEGAGQWLNTDETLAMTVTNPE